MACVCPSRRCVGTIAILCSVAAACKYDRPADVPDGGRPPPDAARDHGIGGTVAGLWQGTGVVLRLQSAGIDELATRSTSGAFTFSARLRPSAAYSVGVSGQPSRQMCTVTGGSGTVGNSDIDSVAVACTPSFAVEVTTSAPVSWTFDPAVVDYVIDTSILTQLLRVTAKCATATALRVNGTVVVSGAESPPIPLNEGDNHTLVDIAVAEIAQQYALTIRRGALPVSQSSYTKALNADPGDRYGVSVAVDRDRIAVAATGEDSGRSDNPNDNTRTDAGAVYLLQRTGTQWSQEAYIKHRSVPSPIGFGRAVAISGSTLAVGDVGHVQVYRLGPGGWTFAQELTNGSSTFGWHVQMLDDVMIVADPAESTVGPMFGAVHVYRWNGTTWASEQILRPTGTLNPGEPEFGLRGMALGAGVVAASFWEDGGPRVQVYRRSGGIWRSDGVLVPASGFELSDEFGSAIAATSDLIAVGAPGEDGGSSGIGGNRLDNTKADSGAVYLFKYSGGMWTDDSYVKAPNTGAGDRFGSQVVLDGEIMVIAAPGEDSSSAGVDPSPNEGAADSGAAYIYRRVADLWMAPRFVKSSNPDPGDGFGGALALSPDTVVVGADREDSEARGVGGGQSGNSAPDSGAVYLFR